MIGRCSLVWAPSICRIGAANGRGAGRRPHPLCRTSVYVVMFALLGITPAFGQQWRVQPAITVGLVFNDNIELTEADPQSSTGTILGLAVRALRSTENGSVGLSGALSRTTYSSVEELDTTTGLLGVDLGYQAERSQFGLSTSLSTQSTQTSEAATTGLSDANGQQYRFGISPFWYYLLSERASLGVSVSYDNVFYEDVEGSGLSDYQSAEISLSGSYRLTEQANLDARLGYGRYEAADRQTDAVSAEVGVGYAISEAFSVNVLFGLQSSESNTSESNGGGESGRSTGPTYTLSAVKALARGGEFTMSATRSLVPSGGGDILDTTALNAILGYPLSERWRLSLRGQVYRNRQPGAEIEDSVLYAAAGEVRLSYQIRESLGIQLGYRYRWQEGEQARTSADSNEVSVNLAWQPL